MIQKFMLIDDVTIHARAGRGGNGVVRFARTMMTQGPTGGDGGNGGKVVLRGVSDLGALRPFRQKKDVHADNGKDGEQNTCTGADGEDLIIPIPVGTLAHNLTTGEEYDMEQIGQEFVVATGGNGGFGNFHFRSSRNTTPEECNPGAPGEEVDLHLQLKLIADVGFVGLPNIGKSSLLNELTNASSRVANYQFTTLEPHLGVYYELVLADIPGLIAGAAEGKGLGHKFLKHVERTRVLFHFVAADSEDPVADYKAIRAELGAFNPKLLEKQEWVIVSRSDERSNEEVQEIIESLKKENPQVVSLSILDESMMVDVKRVLNEIKDAKKSVDQVD